jgi:hypothetical protein
MALIVDLNRERRRRLSPVVQVSGRRYRIVRPGLARLAVWLGLAHPGRGA